MNDGGRVFNGGNRPNGGQDRFCVRPLPWPEIRCRKASDARCVPGKHPPFPQALFLAHIGAHGAQRDWVASLPAYNALCWLAMQPWVPGSEAGSTARQVAASPGRNTQSSASNQNVSRHFTTA